MSVGLAICIGGRGSATIGAMKQRLKQALSQRQKSPVVDAVRLPSAVLVPIYDKQGQYYILLPINVVDKMAGK